MAVGAFLVFGGKETTEAESEADVEPLVADEDITEIATPESEPTEAPQTATEQPAPPSLAAVGGGSGMLGFNAASQGYLVDVSCVLATGLEVACDAGSNILPTTGGITPRFGTWSPDGSQMGFVLGEADGRMFVADASGSNPSPVGSSGDAITDPVWSPDGSRVAFIADGNLWVTDASCMSDGQDCLSAGTQLTDSFQSVSRPVWSPDSSRLAYLQQQSTGLNLAFAIPASGGEPVTLTPFSSDVGILQWMPDGARIMYADDLRGSATFFDRRLQIAPADGSQPTTILTFSRGEFGTVCRGGGVCPGAGEFDLSPDGHQVAVSFNTNTTEDTEIYLLDLVCLETGAETCQESLIQATNNEVDDGNPTWSPDGSLLAFLRARSTNFDAGMDAVERNSGADAFIVNADGSSEKQASTLGFVDFVRAGAALSTRPQWQPAVE